MYGVVLETPIIWKNDVVFQYIFVLLAEKKKKVYPVFISGVFICILMDYGFMTNSIDNMLSLCPVSEDTIQELKKCMILCRFPKKYQLIKENTFCKSAYFIEKGMTRSFWLVNGEEITTSFSWEGGIVFSMDELYYNKPSEEFVETLEDVVVYKISLADLTRLFQTNIELANWGRIIHQNEYRRLHRSHKERLTLPAKERYEEFKQQFPQICQRVKLRYIASYLGITLPTLSRLRAKK